MSLNDVINWVSDVVRQHEGWAIPIIFFLAFGESLAFLSLLLPATVILLALGALIGESGIAFGRFGPLPPSGRFSATGSLTGSAITIRTAWRICGRCRAIHNCWRAATRSLNAGAC